LLSLLLAVALPAAVKLTPAEWRLVTNWIDTHCQCYGSDWGRRHLQYAGLPDVRPTPSFDQARGQAAPAK
jgi:hypothetical protein